MNVTATDLNGMIQSTADSSYILMGIPLMLMIVAYVAGQKSSLGNGLVSAALVGFISVILFLPFYTNDAVNDTMLYYTIGGLVLALVVYYFLANRRM